MSAAVNSPAPKPWSAAGLILVGVAVAFAAWLLPANLRSLNPPLLHAAGSYTSSVAAFGRDLIENQRLGAAAEVLAAARELGDPQAPALAAELARAQSRQPAVSAWGAWDPFLDSVLHFQSFAGQKADTPVLDLLLPRQAREKIGAALDNSGSFGVQDLLRLRDLANTGRFVPANRPGGQPLDALILLSAALYQGGHFTDPLQREVRDLTEDSLDRHQLADLEPFYLDLLSLGRRLDWGQLTELLRHTDGVGTIDTFARLARIAPKQFAPAYAAALMAGSSDHAADYLSRFGSKGADDLRLALRDGQGAVQLLLNRQLPVSHRPGPTLSVASALVLAHPEVMLVLKYAGYLIGFFLILRGLDLVIPSPLDGLEAAGAAARLRAALFALVLAGGLILATEPFLLRAAPAPAYRVTLRVPITLAATAPAARSPLSSTVTMETSTLVSIGIFLSFQVVIYLICLRKISDINDQDITPLLKLRLMENEENLFDSGLYVGMIGTAAALVLQVLGVIQPNLLAAYSSNLFGIICVAFVKIRHVRGFKRILILQAQAALPGTPTAPVAS